MLHDHTALEAAIWHRQNDIERFSAVPPNSVGESMRNQPMPPNGALEDENYREVIGMLQQAIKDKAKKRKHSRSGHSKLPSRYPV